ncbi:MAG TPA: hypothetical protein IAC62_03895 [Candidatus Pelethocola excrementipullorum]|nr:hypothetical protein [Candidatus Pelethocola excrementipullorum]
MKKFVKSLIVGVVLTCTMAVMAGCGAKKEAATFANEQDGMKAEVVLEAEDDKVNKLTMSFIFPAELVDEDQAEMMEAGYKTLEETGIKVSSDKTDEEFTIKMEIPIEEKTLEALKDLDLDLDSTDFSFKAMKQELLDDGFTEKK